MQSYLSIVRRKAHALKSLIPQEWMLASVPESPLPDLRALPNESHILTSEEVSITSSYDVTSLAAAIRDRTLSAEAVTVAFCKRAAIAQQLTNCLTEILFDSAIEHARHLDREFARTGKTRGPLHGIPVSLKDTFHIKGFDTSIGISSLVGKAATENAVVVDTLLEQGAVLYCKTNVSQTLMALDSQNHIFGRVVNPRNPSLSAGGSTGGEGALIAMRGSLLGIGTDMGGSVRLPAMCAGLCSIKPSAQRVSFSGQEVGQPPALSRLGLRPSVGAIATSVRDCGLFMRAMANGAQWNIDPDVVFRPWETHVRRGDKPPLFGVLRSDGVTSPLPPIAKVLGETVDCLRQNDVEVVEVNSEAIRDCQKLTNAFFSIDGNNHILDLLDKTGEPLIPWLQNRLERRQAASSEQLRTLHLKKAFLEKQILSIWRDSTGRTIDALVCPVTPHPVPEIARWNGVGYTSIFNLLDYPAGTLPVRDFTNNDMEDELPDEAKILSGWDARNRSLWSRDSVNREVYLDSPLSIQVVAPKLQEERLLRMMSFLEGILSRRRPYIKTYSKDAPIIPRKHDAHAMSSL